MSGQPEALPETRDRTERTVRTAMLLGAAVLVAADLGIKVLAEAVLSNGATTDLGLINFRLLYNTGVAFSVGADLPA